MGLISTVYDLKNISQCNQLPSQLIVYEQDFETFFLHVTISYTFFFFISIFLILTRIYLSIYILKDAASYYDRLSTTLLSNLDTISYFLKIDELITQEFTTCQKYLHHQTAQKVKNICINTLLAPHSITLFKGLGISMNNMAKILFELYQIVDNNNENSLPLLQYNNAKLHLSPLKLIHNLFLSVQNISSSSQLGSELLQSFSLVFMSFCVNLGEIHRLNYSNQLKILHQNNNINNNSNNNSNNNNSQLLLTEGVDNIQRLGKSNIVNYVGGLINLIIFFHELSSNLFQEHTNYVRAIKKASSAIINCDIDTINFIELYIIYCGYYMTV